MFKKVLGLHPVIARILVARGINSLLQAQDFLGKSGLKFFDPWLLKDMDKAVDGLLKAIRNQEQICVYGDYDADGITATALLMRFCRWLGLRVGCYIPHRVEEGYGLNINALEKIVKDRHKVLLTVDTGATAVSEVEWAKEAGLRVIITDHHQVGDILPPAAAVVDPARPDCRYPFSQLAGVGVAFKLISALAEALKIENWRAEEFLQEQMDLVALGTIADIVPLIGENRNFVIAGLETIAHTANLGLSQLIEQAGIAGKRISSREVAFYLAPRINAAGRTAHASLAVELLLTDDPLEAERLAKHLNRLNDRRQKLEAGILSQCLRQIESRIDLAEERVIVAAQEGWHVGLLGLVASRVAELFRRPTFVLSLESELARGSGRSYGEFSIFEALRHCQNILRAFGGHHSACGIRLLTRDLPSFRSLINEYARGHQDEILGGEKLVIDTEISATELKLELVEALRELEPFGEGNPSPLLLLKDVYLLEPPRVVGANHLKLLLSDKEKTISAIGFEMGEIERRLQNCYKRRPLSIAFEPMVSEWNNELRVEMKIKDIMV